MTDYNLILRRLLGATLVIALSGCSFLVDRSAEQCKTDADCVQFGGHPACQGGVCVSSGLGPEGCVIGAPQNQLDHLNACSTATCVIGVSTTRSPR